MESIGSLGDGGNNKDDHCNDLDDVDGQRSDEDDMDDIEHDILGSCGSGDDTNKGRIDDDNESLNHSLSSPGGLSGLSSLQSPSARLASPLSLLTSPATTQQGNGLLNKSVSEQLQQQHMQVLHAQQQHLNQQLLQQTKLHHQKSSGYLQQQQQLIGLTVSNSGTTAVSAYDGGTTINAVTGVVSTLLPTHSTSSSSSSTGSMSGYGSSSSTNTSSTSSPASLSDRMVRSLLTGSPAMLLGNRIGHIAMGLAMSNNSNNNSNNNNNNRNNNVSYNSARYRIQNELGNNNSVRQFQQAGYSKPYSNQVRWNSHGQNRIEPMEIDNIEVNFCNPQVAGHPNRTFGQDRLNLDRQSREGLDRNYGNTRVAGHPNHTVSQDRLIVDRQSPEGPIGNYEENDNMLFMRQPQNVCPR